jgi:cell division protein FtsL
MDKTEENKVEKVLNSKKFGKIYRTLWIILVLVTIVLATYWLFLD